MLKFCLLFLLSTLAYISQSHAAVCSPSNPTNCYTLQLHYTFEEGSNVTTEDLSGNNRHGILGTPPGNEPVWALDGSNGYLDFTRSNKTLVTSPSFQPPADGVVAFWYKVPSIPSERRRIFGFDDGWEIRWEPDNVMYLDINKTGTNNSIKTSGVMPVVNTWVHIAVVTSSTNNTWSVYVNGALDNSGSETLTSRSSQVLTIGTRTGSSDYFTGSIDDFRIYSGVLTPAEISELANGSPSCCLSYPYETDFEGTNTEWAVDNDWVVNDSAHNEWQARSGSKFLDNNPSEIDQEYHRNHYAAMTQSVLIPADAVLPTLSYYYKVNVYSGQFYSMISTDGTNWSTLETYVERNNHNEYTRRDVNLDAYKGQSVQIRFRQYINSGVGPRLFVIDDLRIGDFQADEYGYPYNNGFETPAEREEFNYEGDWKAFTAHDTHWYPSEGSYFLDNNYNNENQAAHYTQYTTMNGFVTLPSGSASAMISFDYVADIFSGSTHIQIQEYGTNTWVYLKGFTDKDNHQPYTRYEYYLTKYLGKKVRFRFRQSWSNVAGSRVFSIDNIFIGELAETLPFPYLNDFETPQEQSEWQTEGDWNTSIAHDGAWFPSSGNSFLDNNADNEDQANSKNHYATMSGYIPLPADSSNVIVSYDYLLNTFDGQSYIYIQKRGESSWKHIKTYNSEFNRSDHTQEEISLAAYAGEQVRFRFRQYYYSETGPRVFVIDNFKVEEQVVTDYNYPYFNDFETDISTPSINGQDQWNNVGDWSVSQAHDTVFYPENGSYFLDNNTQNVDQAKHRNHYSTMMGYVQLPALPASPMISFDYHLDIFDGYTYLQVQEEGSNAWKSLRTFRSTDNHTPYTKYEIFLSAYAGKKVRFRFRQYYNSEAGPRLFSIDNVFIGELTQTLPFPYSNGFETPTEQAQWQTEGDWNTSTAHDDKWFPSSGSSFLDNNADNEDQASKRDHYATMSGYIPLPADSSNVVVKFDYLLDVFDGQMYLHIQKMGESTWTNIETYKSEFNRDKYTQEERSLAAYAGEQVRFRFRQYYNSSSGPRVFAIDNFKVENVTLEEYDYPYFNDFETVVSTSTLNGQDNWANIGDWDISEAHDDIYMPESGSFFLDNNAKNEDQAATYYHYATMKGFIQLPSAPENPMVSFDYQLELLTGYAYIQIQEQGSNTWRTIKAFNTTNNHQPYTKFEAFLADYAGKKVRFRFRQHLYNIPGKRIFSIDNFFVGELTESLPYPYTNTFETEPERVEWQTEGDWAVSTAHDEKWFPKTGSYFLDNNADNDDQVKHREHYATLSGYIQLPVDASNSVLSFDYLLNTFDGQSYIYIQEFGQATWRNLKTFNESFNHTTYAREEISLTDYAGKKVRFRFRQYYYNEAGPRVFAIDNFHVGEPLLPDLAYPYFNDFETPESTPSTNGSDHWNHQGDWNISTAHDDYFPKNGTKFLDNNADNENQSGHYNHYVDLAGYVPIDINANSPMLSFWYRAKVFDGWTYLELQEKGQNEWKRIFNFSDSFNHNEYAKFYYDLSDYKGKSVRIRYRQYWRTSSTGPRVFSIDDFRIGDDDRVSFAYPYTNTFETPEEREEFEAQGDWGISTAHDVDYVPFEGSWFMDNNVDFEDQRLHLQHYITMSSYIPIPASASLPTLTFKYKANSFDSGTYLEVKRKSESTWTNIHSFTDSFNHQTYVTYEKSLEAYKGDEILIRFRQYWRYESGPRLFVVDNLRVGDFIQNDFIFPYYNDFETAESTASRNGRDHWNTEGDWGISDQNNVIGDAESGDWFLDNNPGNEDQSRHYNHYAAMTGFVHIPSSAVNPEVSFDYVSNLFSSYMYLYIQRENNPTWYNLKRFSSTDNTTEYTNYSRSLNSYKGESVRFRFRQLNYSPSGARQFDVDNFTIDQELLGIWYFEENWQDATGQGFDLVPQNTPTFNDETPRAKDGPVGSDTSTCFYTGYTDGQYAVAENTASQHVFNELTASFWIKPDEYKTNVNSILTKGDDFSIFLDGSGRIQWQYLGTQLSTSTAAPLDKWTHIAVTFKDGEQHIYINGISAASATVTGILTGLEEDLHIAADLNSDTNTAYADRFFEGSIDELRVYRIAQDAAAISNDMDVLHDCEISTIPDHYRIEHDGSGLTCDAETITIKACDDEACTELNTESKTVDFMLDGVLHSTITFIGEETLSFNQLSPKTVGLSIANPVTPAINATQCFNGSVNSCDIVFADAGFKFTYGAANSENIDLQTAGVNFADTLKIQAVQSTSGVCSALFSNKSVSVALSQENIVPTAKTSGNTFSANGVNLPKYDYDLASPAYADVNLSFDVNGYANIPSRYYDAGQIKLHAQYNQSGINIKGASQNFWVKPYALQLSATNATPHVAGELFDFTVTAVAENDAITQNYLPYDIQLAVTRLDPISITPAAPDYYIGGVDGSFVYADSGSMLSDPIQKFESVTLNTFALGQSYTINASYSEVGLFSLDIQDVNYAGVIGDLIPSEDKIEVGRFIPDHFKVEVTNDGVFDNTCSAFTYTGQPFSYSLAPELTITAHNKAGEITRNYTEASKLSNTDIQLLFPTTFTETYETDPITMANFTTGYLPQAGTLIYQKSKSGETDGGVMTYELSTIDSLTYAKTESVRIPPVMSTYNITVESFNDSDNVSYQPDSSNPEIIEPTGVNLRYGRLAMANNFGPETEDLPVLVAAQYWDGDAFVINELDSCTNLDSDQLSLTPAGITIKSLEDEPLNQGTSSKLSLEAPGTQGDVELEYDISVAPWLQYNWDMASPAVDSNPKATATFGRFRGNDRVIFWKEVF